MKIKDIYESTCAGAVAPVAMPMNGGPQRRTKESVDVPGLQPAEKVMKGKAKKKGPYANSISESKKVSEAQLEEEDIILMPGQGRNMRTGFHSFDPDKAEHEGETLKNSLRTIVRLASELDKRLSDKDQFPEWVSEKIGGIKAMMSSTMQYLASQQDAGKPFESIPNGGTIAGGVAFEASDPIAKRITVKKWGGDDKYSWAVLVDGRPAVTGLGKNEVNHYKALIMKKLREKPSLTGSNIPEGAKVDRMVKHIAKSEREAGKSKDKATDIAWATANKRGYLDNKNHKKGK
jgi:hypothetical protein